LSTLVFDFTFISLHVSTLRQGHLHVILKNFFVNKAYNSFKCLLLCPELRCVSVRPCSKLSSTQIGSENQHQRNVTEVGKTNEIIGSSYFRKKITYFCSPKSGTSSTRLRVLPLHSPLTLQTRFELESLICFDEEAEKKIAKTKVKIILIIIFGKMHALLFFKSDFLYQKELIRVL
jgi:hypothetical protein